MAALKDKAHAEKSIRMVIEGRRYLYRELDRMGLFYLPSQANFIFMDLGKDSKEVLQDLLERRCDHPARIYLGISDLCEGHRRRTERESEIYQGLKEGPGKA